MAKPTTKQAAVWTPPRLNKLALGSTDSGTKSELTYDGRWEGGGTTPGRRTFNSDYRMPRSGEPVTDPNPWQ